MWFFFNWNRPNFFWAFNIERKNILNVPFFLLADFIEKYPDSIVLKTGTIKRYTCPHNFYAYRLKNSNN